MENRVTRLLLPILIAVAAFMILQQFLGDDKKQDANKSGTHAAVALQESAATSAPLSTGDGVIERWFGKTPGDPGFKVWFHDYGGTIQQVDFFDFFETPKARDAKDPEKLYRAIRAEPGVHSFAIEDFQGRFPLRTKDGLRRIGQVGWVRKKGPDDQTFIYELVLENGITIRKIYRFFEKSRHFELTIELERHKEHQGKALPDWWTYRLRGASCLSNPKSEWFMNPAVVFAGSEGSDEPTYLSASTESKDGDYPDVPREDSAPITYAGSMSRFFACIFLAGDAETRRAIEAVELRQLPSRDGLLPEQAAKSNAAAVLRLKQRMPKAVKDKTRVTFDVFLGPKDRSEFAADEKLAAVLPALDIDYTSQGCCCPIPGIAAIAKGLLWILKLFYSLVGNWGVAIILLTLVVRGAMMPLTLNQARHMRGYSEKMQRLKPEMDALRKKYEKDPQQLNKKMLEFQKQHKLFPPLMGCLPMFLSMPVWIGLFTMLRATFELRHAPFAGWIDDLSLPDRAFELGITDLPLLGNMFEYFNVLPLLMLILWSINMFRQKLPDDPQQRSMQRMMRFMPLLFFFMLYSYASGLALYMVVSAVWTFFEQWVQKKKFGSVGSLGATPM